MRTLTGTGNGMRMSIYRNEDEDADRNRERNADVNMNVTLSLCESENGNENTDADADKEWNADVSMNVSLSERQKTILSPERTAKLFFSPKPAKAKKVTGKSRTKQEPAFFHGHFTRINTADDIFQTFFPRPVFYSEMLLNLPAVHR